MDNTCITQLLNFYLICILLLLFDSDKAYTTLLTDVLQERGFSVLAVSRHLQLTDQLHKQDYELCLVSMSACEKETITLVREEQPDTIIICLVEDESDEQICLSYNNGANDHWRKSESVGVLLSKLNMWQQRLEKQKQKQPLTIQIGEYQLDSVRRILTYNDEERKLTAKENELLLLLGRNKNELVARRQILRQIWPEDNYFNARSLSVFIHRLRQYLSKDQRIQITCVAQKSYRLSVATE